MTQVKIVRETGPIYPANAKSRKSVGGGNKLMSTGVVARYSPQTWSLNDLSTELLTLIFEQLRDIDPRALAGARRLSKRFEVIVTPVQFDTVLLNRRIIASRTEVLFPRILENIYLFARHIEVRSDLDPVDTRRVLDRVQRLSTLRWRFVGNRPRSGFSSMPSDILSPGHINIRNIRLYVEDLPFGDLDGDLYDAYLLEIPANNVISIKMISPTPPLTTRLESLKRLLLEARRIETFHYNDRGQGTRFSFEGNERLPAFVELLLRSYDWNHSADAVQKHWDFSRLQRLALIDVPMFEFLDSIPFAELRQLHMLHCEDFSTHLPDRREEATRALSMLVSQIQALHTLKITCHTSMFPIYGLLRHADSLRILSFRDYVGFGDERQHCPTLRVEDLALLSQRLVNLHTAELDMDAALCDPARFLRLLCEFLRLEILVLHTQTVLQAADMAYPGHDRDHQAAIKTFSTLLHNKQGRPWRRITLNIGGWKPGIVPRISEAWREQNKRGIYTERCFVWEASMGKDGVSVREEVGVDRSCDVGSRLGAVAGRELRTGAEARDAGCVSR
ncbi:hypothetical protein GGR54DRAFT_125460 [Hypoxylon sp. NC1633]|nr:hypothetical protein GGR54DRAFT_125460 [Hypoxylon sp. NC1633]